MRADARRNRDRILVAAREAFAEAGLAVPLDEIAARAGVGPGTVYRHFPTKEALFQTVITERVAGLVAEARRRATDDDAGEAFFGFLALLGAEGAAKRDTSDAMTVPGPIIAELHEAVGVLLTRAQDAGAVRPRVTTEDLFAFLKSLLATVHDTGDQDRGERLLAILADGLRATGPRGPAAA